MARILGCDVSRHQGKIDFNIMKSMGYEFVFIRAGIQYKTSSSPSIDDRFVENWTNAKKAGILRGAYYMNNYIVEPVTQAYFFCNLIANDPGELPPVMDIEQMIDTPHPPRISWLKWILTFSEIIQNKLGVKPIFYTNPSTITYLNVTEQNWLLQHDLWVAHYLNKISISLGKEPTYKPWGKWSFWQWTDRTAPAGVESKQMDADYFNGDLSDLLAYSANRMKKQPIPQTKPLTLEEKVERLWKAHPELQK